MIWRSFPAGPLKKLYVDRKRATEFKSPNVCEVRDPTSEHIVSAHGIRIECAGACTMYWDKHKTPSEWWETSDAVIVIESE